ncbi:uncharacterized protein [Ptychodera flava]|uniref:uncharacterized protein n=1 Tax=Ptychodera flava TaxID=63121 RepID=UPI00396A209E
MLDVSWRGGDDESGVYDYLVGLSSTGQGLNADILPLTSTHSHPRFITYHPNLGEGVVFYIVVQSINRARLTTTKVFGPIIVEVTAPEFTGVIIVQYEEYDGQGHLVAKWDEDSFFEKDDPEPLSDYKVAVGSTPYGTQLLQFTPVSEFQSRMCETTQQPSCVGVPTDILDWDLHGDHIYYMSIKVTNVAGLTVTATSEPYRHLVDLPSAGVVLDTVNPESAGVIFGELPDIDFQSVSTELHSRWHGFAHPYQDVSYEIAVGSSPGDDNIVKFTNVGVQTQYSLYGLLLSHYEKYFITVRAQSESGFVTASSDGVTILSDNDVIDGAFVFDGMGCADKGKNDTYFDRSHHDYTSRLQCSDDIEYQASKSTVFAHWIVNNKTMDFISYIEVGIERENCENSSYPTWDVVHQYDRMHVAKYVQFTGMNLTPGDRYRTIVKFCFPDGCFQQVYSSGFWVIPYNPVSEGIENIFYNGSLLLEFTWAEFVNVELNGKLESEEYMDYYEWNIAVDTEASTHGNFLYKWMKITNPNHNENKLTYTATLEDKLIFSDCLNLAIRGHNKAGLYSTIYKTIVDCDSVDPLYVVPNIVIDAVGETDEHGDVK